MRRTRRVIVPSRESRSSKVTTSPGSTASTGGMSGCQRLWPPGAPSSRRRERSISIRALTRRVLPGPRAAYSPYERPITSSMTSSVPAPMRFRRMSRQARSMPYSFM